MSTTEANPQPVYEWNTLPWKRIQQRVFKLQVRIYRASHRGDTKTVHRLQRLLMHSWSAKCLAVRRVTQDNRGKKTAGVDGVKALAPKQRLKLVANLDLTHKPRPVRRVWIPKPHQPNEKRGLGIPVMHDRAAQALVKLALESEWEAKFEPNSYGFRPGRSAHDAIGAIFLSASEKDKYFLDADISKCFDRINHAALLVKTGTPPGVRRLLRGWLEAGVMDGRAIFPTEEGTPQGGTISPLLANIALHGMEEVLQGTFPPKGHNPVPRLIRYADDFVVLHPDRATIERAKQVIAGWLAGMGVELKPEKTRVGHTLRRTESEAGFNFLGFNVRHYPVGKRHTPKNAHGKRLGFKLLIKPTKEAGKAHQEKVKHLIRQHRGANQGALIRALNPVIRGWSSYYRTVVSSVEFSRQDHLMSLKLYRWAKYRHPRHRSYWRRYFHPYKGEKGRFQTAPRPGKRQLRLYEHTDMHILRHVKVKGARSPYDGDLVYWSTRMGRHPEVAPKVARLMQRQKGRCAHCGLFFQAEDLVENDHIAPRSQGGSYLDENRQLLHRHCHDLKSAHDKGEASEEPCAAKVASTVLEGQRAGRPAR